MPHSLTVSGTRPILHLRVTIGPDPNSVKNSDMDSQMLRYIYHPSSFSTEKNTLMIKKYMLLLHYAGKYDRFGNICL